jgi:hypothetical protein
MDSVICHVKEPKSRAALNVDERRHIIEKLYKYLSKLFGNRINKCVPLQQGWEDYIENGYKCYYVITKGEQKICINLTFGYYDRKNIIIINDHDSNMIILGTREKLGNIIEKYDEYKVNYTISNFKLEMPERVTATSHFIITKKEGILDRNNRLESIKNMKKYMKDNNLKFKDLPKRICKTYISAGRGNRFKIDFTYEGENYTLETL